MELEIYTYELKNGTVQYAIANSDTDMLGGFDSIKDILCFLKNEEYQFEELKICDLANYFVRYYDSFYGTLYGLWCNDGSLKLGFMTLKSAIEYKIIETFGPDVFFDTYPYGYTLELANKKFVFNEYIHPDEGVGFASSDGHDYYVGLFGYNICFPENNGTRDEWDSDEYAGTLLDSMVKLVNHYVNYDDIYKIKLESKGVILKENLIINY